MARVLVVDDDADLLHLMEMALRSAGHCVTRARDGVEALTVLDASDVDVLVTDNTMPRMSGISLAAELRSQSPRTRVRILMVSGTAAPGDLEEAMRAGVDDFLSKPCSLRDLLAAVQQLSGDSADGSPPAA